MTRLLCGAVDDGTVIIRLSLCIGYIVIDGHPLYSPFLPVFSRGMYACFQCRLSEGSAELFPISAIYLPSLLQGRSCDARQRSLLFCLRQHGRYRLAHSADRSYYLGAAHLGRGPLTSLCSPLDFC